jgi:hypothetical protein
MDYSAMYRVQQQNNQPITQLTNYLSACSRVLLENPTAWHLVKKSPNLMEPQSSKPCPKGPTLVPVPSQSQFNPGPAILSLQQPISYPPINAQIFQVVYLLQHLTKTLSISLLLPYMSNTQFSLFSLCKQYAVLHTWLAQRHKVIAQFWWIIYHSVSQTFLFAIPFWGKKKQGSSYLCSNKYGVWMIGIQN